MGVEMKPIEFDASMTMLIGDDGLGIEIYDENASICICKIKLGPEETCAALGRRAFCKAKKAIAYGLDRIGKYMILDTLMFEMSEHDYSTQKQVAADMVREICPDGWVPDTEFNSQDSFHNEGDKTIAKTIIRAWVSREEKEKWEREKRTVCRNCGGRGFVGGDPDDEAMEDCVVCDGEGTVSANP